MVVMFKGHLVVFYCLGVWGSLFGHYVLATVLDAFVFNTKQGFCYCE